MHPTHPAASDLDRLALVALSFTPGATTLHLAQHRGPAAVLDLDPDRDQLLRRARTAVATAEALGGRVIVPGDTEWPAQLQELPANEVPLCLWALGPAKLTDVTARSVTITGSRAATAYGTHMAGQFAYDLADGHRGWTVATGGQFGVEAAAARAAANAPDGTPPLLVTASGIDQHHPTANASLFRHAAEEGVLISAEPPGRRPRRETHHRRLRLMGTLTTGTLIVEALTPQQRAPARPGRLAAQPAGPRGARPGHLRALHRMPPTDP